MLAMDAGGIFLAAKPFWRFHRFGRSLASCARIRKGGAVVSVTQRGEPAGTLLH